MKAHDVSNSCATENDGNFASYGNTLPKLHRYSSHQNYTHAVPSTFTMIYHGQHQLASTMIL